MDPLFPGFEYVETFHPSHPTHGLHDENRYRRSDGAVELLYINRGNGLHYVSVAPAHETWELDKYSATGSSPEQAFRDATDELRIVTRKAIREHESSIRAHLREIDRENALIDALRSCLPT
jgi:hypothetical protein